MDLKKLWNKEIRKKNLPCPTDRKSERTWKNIKWMYDGQLLEQSVENLKVLKILPSPQK